MIKIIHQTDSNIKFTYKNVEYTREYQRGDDALYIQLNDTKGLKIIYPNAKYGSQETTYNNLLVFKRKLCFFHNIYTFLYYLHI